MPSIDQLTPAEWGRINAIGASVITVIAIAASIYLFVVLIRQGQGKLRVRLLLGMVTSDFLLGISVLPQEIAAAAGKPTPTGTKSCDVGGFFFTAILFTQHLWTALIAIATYMLLKHPMSSFTTLLERHSWWWWVLIWGVSFLHSGIWWATSGYSSNGTLCYYAPRNDSYDMVDPRDLMQFIPRALVFLIIIILYSRLFHFLRRPDTITLSNDPLDNSDYDNQAGQLASDDSDRSVMYNPFSKMAAKISGTKSPPPPSHQQGKGLIGPEAPPWEALEFVTVGNRSASQHTGHSATKLSTSYSVSQEPKFATISTTSADPGSRSLRGDPFSATTAISPTASIQPAISPSRAATPSGQAPIVRDMAAENNGIAPDEHRKSSMPDMASDTSGSKRPSDADSIRTPESANQPLPHSIPAPTKSGVLIVPTHDHSVVHILEPAISAGSMEKRERSDSGTPSLILPKYPHPVVRRPPSPEDDDGSDPNGETLAQFFDSTADPESRSQRGSNAGQQMSATAYFNRQASILMLWFPLTYLFVFSVSLARLIYDMVVDGPPNPLFLLISAWFVLSVGFVDAIVYGAAEYIVKRRVRRNLPDRI